MKLAIIGARGIGNHGGFETVVREIAPRLQERGHEVFCSVRRSDDCGAGSEFKGVKLLCFPFSFPESYSFGKIWEVFYDSFFVLKCRFFLKCDAVYCLGVASGIALLLTKPLRSATLINVDGLEWTRGKFGALARLFLRVSFLASCIGSDRIVLDNQRLEESVPVNYRRKCVFIPYGVSTMSDPVLQPASVSESPALDEGGYWLVVARLEPENNIHTIMEAYLLSESSMPLVIVGGYSSRSYEKTILSYLNNLRDDKKIVMKGPIYDQRRLTYLRRRCAAYIHGHSVGGTNPSLLEAMSVGNTILSHDNVFNREVCMETAKYFKDAKSLADLMDDVGRSSASFRELGVKARERVERHYRWDDVVARHETLLTGARLR